MRAPRTGARYDGKPIGPADLLQIPWPFPAGSPTSAQRCTRASRTSRSGPGDRRPLHQAGHRVRL